MNAKNLTKYITTINNPKRTYLMNNRNEWQFQILETNITEKK